jgi:hypothetical protein
MKTISQRLHGWSQRAASHSLNYQHARLISRLRRSTKPILVGPFRGEVGFEVLYWIPWLRYLRETLKIAPERIIPIGRAGSACWYGCPTGVELYSLRTPQDLRLVNRINQQKYGMLKQIYYDAFDKAVVQDVAESLNLTDYELIHPRHMYRTLAAYWAGDRGFAWLMNRVGYVFPLPTVPLDVKLPEKFVAVRFYGRSTFPASPQTTDLAQATIEQLARQHPVVLLNNGLHADEHQDFHISGPNITTIRDYVSITEADNLQVVSSVMAKAMGFVGTYGGLAQLALSLGKPSVSFYTEGIGVATAVAHWNLSIELSLRSGVPFLVQRVNDLPLLGAVLPTVSSSPLAAEPIPA